MSKYKYKVGDEVLVKGKIMDIDSEDKIMPYRIDTKNDVAWVEETEIVGAETKSDIIPVIPQSQVDAYNKGHADGMAQGLNDGKNEVWEFIRNYSFFPSKEDWEEFMEFANIESASNFFSDYTYEEALAKLKAYEEAQALRLGEIVIVNIPDEKGIVIVECQDGEYKVLMEDFDIVKLPASKLTKTGRFVALNNILEQIGE